MRTILGISTALLLTLSACGSKSLTKDECEKLVDHMTDVAVAGQGSGLSPDMIKAAKDMAKEQTKGAIDECVKDGTRGEYDCAMAAKTMKDMEACTK